VTQVPATNALRVLAVASALAAPLPEGAVAGAASAASVRRAGPGAPPAQKPAKGSFLIASRRLADPNFSRTVILLIAHEGTGSMGVVINRPTPVPLSAALPQVAELRGRPERVFAGGPVDVDRMLLLVRARERPADARLVFGDTYVSGSMEVLREALADERPSSRFRAYVGYAGWAPGQLDSELARGDWHVAPADAETVFERAPGEIWTEIVERVEGQWTRRLPGPGAAPTAGARYSGGVTGVSPAAPVPVFVASSTSTDPRTTSRDSVPMATIF